MDEDLTPSERERERRRDRDAAAKARAGMRTGLAKQFKQVLDAQRRRAGEPPENERSSGRRPDRHASTGNGPKQDPAARRDRRPEDAGAD